jgi:hypothetical protein
VTAVAVFYQCLFSDFLRARELTISSHWCGGGCVGVGGVGKNSNIPLWRNGDMRKGDCKAGARFDAQEAAKVKPDSLELRMSIVVNPLAISLLA